MLLLTPLTSSLEASPLEKSFQQDMAYYYKTAKLKKLNANDRLYILDKLREKYRDAEFDLSELYAEIHNQTEKKQKESKKPVPQDAREIGAITQKSLGFDKPLEEKKKGEKLRGRLTNVLVTESDDFSRLLLNCPGTKQYKEIVKKDDKNLQPPVIILYLYNTEDKLKSASKNFKVKNGLIRHVHTQLISSELPTVRVSISLREDRPYQLSKNQDQLLLTVSKIKTEEPSNLNSEQSMEEPQKKSLSGAGVPTLLTPEQTETFERETPYPLPEPSTAPSSTAVETDRISESKVPTQGATRDEKVVESKKEKAKPHFLKRGVIPWLVFIASLGLVLGLLV